MSGQLAETFIEALRTLEETGNAGPISALYAASSVCGNVIAPDRFQGEDGARQFWTEYRGTFTSVKSEFRIVVTAEGRTALEWMTQGTGPDDASLQYSGVTILETSGDKITRSCAYFDPAALGRQMTG